MMINRAPRVKQLVRPQPCAISTTLIGPEKLGALHLNGMVSFSTIDWPERQVAVLFIGGCPWRCQHCRNPELLACHQEIAWPSAIAALKERRGLIDGVVFSGGEPLSELHLPQMIAAVKGLGFRVAMHSGGSYPNRLAGVLPQLDWVGFDINTDPQSFDAFSGRSRSYWPVAISLEILLESNCKFACRSTWDPSWLSEAALVELAENLAQLGVRHYMVQNHRPSDDSAPIIMLGVATLQYLATLFEQFEYR